MKNWSTDTTELKKDPEKYAIWRLEQMINFGLGGKKLKKSEVKKYWKELQIDPSRKAYLQFLIR